MRIPWSTPYLGQEELQEVIETVQSGWLSMGPRVKKLEERMADYVGVKHGIAANSGTAALDVALKAIGINPGDEIIIPAATYIATANAVLYQHAKPVLVDIDPKTYNINPTSIPEKITPRTKCIMPVDYGGLLCDYDTLAQIAKEHNLYLVVDSAESIGGEYKGRKSGTFGDASIFSFHVAKHITTIEGGMLFTNDDQLADRARIIRNQGEDPKRRYHHVLLGHNYRMTDLHAAIGLAQFQRLDDVLKKRSEIAEYYTKNLEEYSHVLTLPYIPPYDKHAWFLYLVLVNNRDEIVEYLNEKGIDTRASPLPIHQQPVYTSMFQGASYPVAEKFVKGCLTLPLYYSLSRQEQDYIIENLRDALEKFARGKYGLG